MASPSDRKYSRKHEWCKLEGKIATVGVTDYAQKQLTDIVFVELPKVGSKAEQGKNMCVVESVKSVSDVIAPVSGEVVEANKQLLSKPELINKEPFGRGWIAKIRLSNEKEFKALLDARQYDEFAMGESKA